MDDELIYEGEFKDNLYNGKGIKYERKKGDVIEYRGEFKNNKLTGRAKIYINGIFLYEQEY